MARIVVSTFGSTGDLNPFIALGLALQGRGHEVIFAVQDIFAPAVVGQGFAVRPLSGNVVTALASAGDTNLGASNPIPSLQALMRYGIMPTLDAHVKELGDACRDADLLVTSYGQLAGSFVAARSDLPWASVVLSPVTVPSAYITSTPHPGYVPDGLERAANRLQWAVGSLVLRLIADRPVNRLRARYGLGPVRESLWLGAASRQLVCVACSPAFQPAPPDWPPYVRITGFCFWDKPESWEPPRALTEFLADSRPYVVVTAGSIALSAEGAFAAYFESSVAAITALGLRALVVGRTNVPSHDGSEVLALPFAPYSLVFPGSTAIIHHGGMGTTAQALRFGVPSLIVPWGVDQFYSASQVTKIGAGEFIYWRRYTRQRAQTALSLLTGNKRYRTQAGIQSSAIAREDGAAALCRELLAMFR